MSVEEGGCTSGITRKRALLGAKMKILLLALAESMEGEVTGFIEGLALD